MRSVVRYLVTGGAGFVGSVVSSRLLDEGHDVVILDDLSTGHSIAIPAGATFVEGRIQDALADVLTSDFDGVLHFAAFIAAGESVVDPGKYWENNLVGSLRVIEAVRAAGVRRMVFSSTANVYGDPDSVPIPETAATRPPNPYAGSKLAVDYALRDEAVAHGLAAVSLRYFNVAGAHGPLGEDHHPETHLIPLVLQAAAGRREHVSIYGTDYPTPDGTAVRDYIHAEDLATAHVLALEKAQAGRHDIFNLGTGTGYSVRDVIDAARKVTGREIAVQEEGRRPGDPPRLVASNARARAALGWEPERSLEQMVADAWAWHEAHPGGYGD
jgi:UDP-glucose 4-epimerase